LFYLNFALIANANFLLHDVYSSILDINIERVNNASVKSGSQSQRHEIKIRFPDERNADLSRVESNFRKSREHRSISKS